VEFLGERTLAHVRLADGAIVGATVVGQSPNVGDTVGLSIDSAEAHLFDDAGRAYHADAGVAGAGAVVAPLRRVVS
jgi:multiple sugar transport system ATP-binding protein